MAKAWLIISLVLVVLVPEGAAATGQGLYGLVLRGPTKPVCSSEDRCSEPAPHLRLRFVRSGTVSSTATTDARGRYRVRLTPGLYKVSVVGRPAGGLGGRVAPATVRVRLAWRHQDLDVDTGIR